MTLVHWQGSLEKVTFFSVPARSEPELGFKLKDQGGVLVWMCQMDFVNFSQQIAPVPVGLCCDL